MECNGLTDYAGRAVSFLSLTSNYTNTIMGYNIGRYEAIGR